MVTITELDDLPTLTPKQTAFINALIQGKTASDAYREAYNCEKMSQGAISAFSLMALAGCDDTPKDTSKQEASVCKGLDEAQCTANNECFWNAEKTKCKEKKSDDKSSQESPPKAEDPAPSAPDIAPGGTPQ